MNNITFKQFLLKFEGEDNLLGDLLFDIKEDPFFDNICEVKAIIDYYENKLFLPESKSAFNSIIKIYNLYITL